MKKAINGIGYNKSSARLVAKSKAINAAETKLKARKATAAKAIIIGSAAIGVAALGWFAVSKFKSKKKGILSLWD